jgi:hypothetical protein
VSEKLLDDRIGIRNPSEKVGLYFLKDRVLVAEKIGMGLLGPPAISGPRIIGVKGTEKFRRKIRSSAKEGLAGTQHRGFRHHDRQIFFPPVFSQCINE